MAETSIFLGPPLGQARAPGQDYGPSPVHGNELHDPAFTPLTDERLHAHANAALLSGVDQDLSAAASPSFVGLSVAGRTQAQRDAAMARSIGGAAFRELLNLPAPAADLIPLNHARAASGRPDWLSFSRASTATRFAPSGCIEAVAADTPRHDWDPATGEYLGLLLEGARTNLATWSEELDNAAWAKVRATVAPNAATAPNGTPTADKLVEDTTATNSHVLTRNFTAAPGAVHTASLFVAPAGRSRGWLRLSGGSDAVTLFFDAASGSAFSASTAGNPASPATSVRKLSGGWCRIAVSGGLNASSLTCQLTLLGPGDSSTYTGDGASGMYVWGIQMEQGAHASSYIPAAGAAATRSADLLGGSLAALGLSGNGFAFLAEAASDNPDVASRPRVLGARADAGNLVAASLAGGKHPALDVTAGGVAQAALQIAAPSMGMRRLAGSAFANRADLAASGLPVPDTDGSVAMPALAWAETLDLGHLDGEAGSFLFGHLRRLALWAVPLTRDQLAAVVA